MASPAARPRLRRDAARGTVNARFEKPAASRAGIAPRSKSVPIIAVTSGEPAGIGPDVCLALARKRFAACIVVLGDREMLEGRARQLGLRVQLSDPGAGLRSEEHTSELQSPMYLVCRLLLEKKKKINQQTGTKNTKNSPCR